MHKSESYPNKVSPHCSAYTVGLNTNKSSSMKLEMDVYGRQNSVNEIKENDLSTQPGKLKVPDYSRQPSECRLINDSVKVVIKGDDFQSTSTISSTESDLKKEKRLDKGNTCCYVVQAFTFLVTILTLGLVVYLYYKVNFITFILFYFVFAFKIFKFFFLILIQDLYSSSGLKMNISRVAEA
jgi:hypothetical protein